MKAIKKPVEIEFLTYEQLLINTYEYVDKGLEIRYDNNTKNFYIDTLEGVMTMTNKDYLIIGVRGEIYPCKIDIFNETYNIVK